MALIALPLIVGATREALQSIPSHVREASYALGKDRISTIRRVLLPASRRGIGTGVTLGMGRIVGDTAIVVDPARRLAADRAGERHPGLGPAQGDRQHPDHLRLQQLAGGGGRRAAEGLRRRLRAAGDRHRPQLRGRPDRSRKGARMDSLNGTRVDRRRRAADRRRGAADGRPVAAGGNGHGRRRPRPRAGRWPKRMPRADTRPLERMRTEELSIAYGRKLAVNRVSIERPPGRGAGADRPLGLRQDDPPALAQPARRPDPGGEPRRPHPARRRGRRPLRRDPPATPGRDALPAAEPVPDEHLRQRRLRSARAWLEKAVASASWSRRCSRRCTAPGSSRRSRTTSTTRRWRSPAASSSGSASPARWRSVPRSCCSTSPARRSTRSPPR